MSTEVEAPFCPRCTRRHNDPASCAVCPCCKFETAPTPGARCAWCSRNCGARDTAPQLAAARLRHLQRRAHLLYVVPLYRVEDDYMRARFQAACAQGESTMNEGLEQKIRAARAAYEGGAPTMSDREFDTLVDKLRATSPSAPVLAEVGAAGGEVAHARPMLSLDKCKDPGAVTAWAERTGARAFLVTPKLDGVALSLTYENGVLVRALTRGDGSKGTDVTALARRFVLPFCGALGQGRVELRGEVVVGRDTHRTVFAPRGASNPRNTVAGLLGRSAPDDDHALLRFVAYDVLLPELSYARRLGHLSGTPMNCVSGVSASSPPELDEALTLMRARVSDPEFPYETDGLVVRADDAGIEEKLGTTAHHPRYAVAFKWAGSEVPAEVVRIVWDVSPAGTLTPVVYVEPVDVDGVTVECASLHHAQRFAALALAPGDVVALTRRGGVIPHVDAVLSRGGELEFSAPRACPSCGGGVVDDAPRLRCANASCPGALRARAVHFAATIGARGLGHTVAAQLDVLYPSDLYSPGRRARWDAVIGAATAERLREELDRAAHEVTCGALYAALAITGLGETKATQLAAALPHPRDLLDASKLAAALAGLDGVAEATAQKVTQGVAAVRGQIEWLCDAIAAGVFVLPVPAVVHADGPFAGFAVVFTGELDGMARHEAQAVVRRFGGKTPGSVTRETTHLVVSDGAGARKRERAEALRAGGQAIEVLDGAQFMALVQRAELLTELGPDEF